MLRTIDAIPERFRLEGAPIQVFEVAGQMIFPCYAPHGGGIYSAAAIYPILRGRGESAPKFDGAFPTEDGATLDLGEGWILMCVRVPFGSSPADVRGKLEAGEKKLRAMKAPDAD